MESGAPGRGGFLDGLSQQARADLIFLAVFVVVATLLQLVIPNGGWWEAMDTFVNNRGGEIDVVVPFFIMGAVGFGVYAFRRMRELQGLNAARERARAAAGRAQEQLERAQQEAEEARRDAEEAQRLNRQLMDTGMNALVKVDNEGKITEANEGMEVATGLHSSRLVGTSVFSFFGDQKRTREWFEQSLEGNSVQGEYAEIVHQDGGTTKVAYNVMVQRNISGQVTGGLLLMRPREEAFTR